MTRGGWKTSSDWRIGWSSFVSAKRNEPPVKVKPGTGACQAQESMRPSENPAGTAGAAGCPEHNAPEQGRGGSGMGIPLVSPVKSWTKGSISDESRPGSVRDVTKCEQLPSTLEGAIRAEARSNRKAPAGRETSCWREEDLAIRRAKLIGPPSCSRGMARN